VTVTGGSWGAAEAGVAGGVPEAPEAEGVTGGCAGGLEVRIALGLGVTPGPAVGSMTAGAPQGTGRQSVIAALEDCLGTMKITPMASTRNPAPAPNAVYQGCLVAASSQRRLVAASSQRGPVAASRQRGPVGAFGQRRLVSVPGQRCLVAVSG
jgi:hypothetical protein